MSHNLDAAVTASTHVREGLHAFFAKCLSQGTLLPPFAAVAAAADEACVFLMHEATSHKPILKVLEKQVVSLWLLLEDALQFGLLSCILKADVLGASFLRAASQLSDVLRLHPTATTAEERTASNHLDSLRAVCSATGQQLKSGVHLEELAHLIEVVVSCPSPSLSSHVAELHQSLAAWWPSTQGSTRPVPSEEALMEAVHKFRATPAACMAEPAATPSLIDHPSTSSHPPADAGLVRPKLLPFSSFRDMARLTAHSAWLDSVAAQLPDTPLSGVAGTPRGVPQLIRRESSRTLNNAHSIPARLAERRGSARTMETVGSRNRLMMRNSSSLLFRQPSLKPSTSLTQAPSSHITSPSSPLKSSKLTGPPPPPPEEYMCPISWTLMEDPVVIESGQTYERRVIENWFLVGRKTCPMTGQKLSTTTITPNWVLKRLITAWKEQHGLMDTVSQALTDSTATHVEGETVSGSTAAHDLAGTGTAVGDSALLDSAGEHGEELDGEAGSERSAAAQEGPAVELSGTPAAASEASAPGTENPTSSSNAPGLGTRDISIDDLEAPPCLVLAAESADLDEVRRLLAAGINPNQRGEQNNSALHHAVLLDSADMIAVLTEHGARTSARNAQGLTPLMTAVMLRKNSALRALLQANASVTTTCDKGTPLHAAAADGNLEAVTLLLEHRAPLEAKDENRNTPLLLASQFRHVPVMRLLLDKGAKPDCRNYEGECPLYFAVCCGNENMVEVLLDAGASGMATRYNSAFGQNALILAAVEGSVGMVELLLRYPQVKELLSERGTWQRPSMGFDDDGDDLSGTPLHAAASVGHVEVVKVLLQHGAEVDAGKDRGKQTPLMFACMYGYLPVVQTLVESGSDVNYVSKTGLTPLHSAVMAEKEDIVKFLLSTGAAVSEEQLRAKQAPGVAAVPDSAAPDSTAVDSAAVDSVAADSDTAVVQDNLSAVTLERNATAVTQEGNTTADDSQDSAAALAPEDSNTAVISGNAAAGNLPGHATVISESIFERIIAEIDRKDSNVGDAPGGSAATEQVGDAPGGSSATEQVGGGQVVQDEGGQDDESDGSWYSDAASEQGEPVESDDDTLNVVMTARSHYQAVDHDAHDEETVGAVNEPPSSFISSTSQVEGESENVPCSSLPDGMHGRRGTALNLVSSSSPVKPPRYISVLGAAAGTGNYRIMKLLLDGGAPVDDLSYDGCTPLFTLLDTRPFDTDDSEVEERYDIRKYIVAAQLLLRYGADPNRCFDWETVSPKRKSKVTPLTVALAKSWDVDMVEVLVKGGADPKRVTFHEIVEDLEHPDLEEAVSFLVGCGGDINGRDSVGETPLHLAARCTDLNNDIIKILLSCGADVHSESGNGFTPLEVAAVCPHVKGVQLLLEAGAAPRNGEVSTLMLALVLNTGHGEWQEVDVDNDSDSHSDSDSASDSESDGTESESQKSSSTDHSGTDSAWDSHVASDIILDSGSGSNSDSDSDSDSFESSDAESAHPYFSSHPAFLRKLKCWYHPEHEQSAKIAVMLVASEGALLHNNSNLLRMTPLHVAVSCLHVVAARALVELGADVNAVDIFGNTPLHVAAVMGPEVEKTVNFLLTVGCDPNQVNDAGYTALDLFMTHDKVEGPVLEKLKDVTAPKCEKKSEVGSEKKGGNGAAGSKAGNGVRGKMGGGKDETGDGSHVVDDAEEEGARKKRQEMYAAYKKGIAYLTSLRDAAKDPHRKKK